MARRVNQKPKNEKKEYGPECENSGVYGITVKKKFTKGTEGKIVADIIVECKDCTNHFHVYTSVNGTSKDPKDDCYLEIDGVLGTREMWKKIFKDILET